MKIGEKIRHLRLQRKLTQSELVEGISSIAYLSMIENGKAKPSKSFLHLITKRLNVDPEVVSCESHSGSSDFYDRIKEITDRFRQYEILSSKDLSFLRINAMEIQSAQVYLKIFGTLLRYYIRIEEIKEAEEIYALSSKFIPHDFCEEFGEDYYYYHVSCGDLFYYKQDFIKANQYYSKAENFSEVLEEKEVAQLYYNISLVKQQILEDKSISLYYSQKSYDIFKKLVDTKNLIKVLLTMGGQYHLIGNFEKSLACLQEAEQSLSLYPDEQLSALIQYNLGRVYQGKKEYDLAILHFKECIQMNDAVSAEKVKIYVYWRLVEIYLELKDWTHIEYYLAEAIQLANRYKLIHCYIKLCALKALTFKLRGDEIKYEREMKKNIILAINKDQISLVINLSNELGNHFFDKRAYKKSADFFKQANAYEKYLNEMNQHTYVSSGSGIESDKMCKNDLVYK